MTLRDFYDMPTVAIRSGQLRASRLLHVLGGITGGSGRPLTVLDVGCGDGAYTRLAADLPGGHRVIGVDWAAAPLRRAKGLGLALVRGGLDRLPFASGSVDVVILSEVIEHLVDTDEALAELHRVLRPGGHLIVTTPNLAAWFNRGALLFGVQPVFSEVSLRKVYGRPGSEVAGHLHMYTRRALTAQIADHGFTRLKVSGACYHDVPRPLRPLDRAFRLIPDLAAILLLHARRP